MSTIAIKGVTKNYGSTKALDAINLSIEPGKIYGLLGRNGAGKTTLLDLITNRIFPSEGEITIGGESVIENDKVLNNIFYMTEKNLYHEGFKVKVAFKWAREFYTTFDMDYANALADKFGLNANKKNKQLSMGYISIFKAILTLASNAKILLFDEPVLGLDAYHREMLYKELIENYSQKPKTIIISTHLIEELADLLEEVIIIKNGKIVRQQSVESLLSAAYTVSGQKHKVNHYLENREFTGEETMGEFKLVTVLEDIKNKNRELANNLDLKFGNVELQKLFINLTN